MLMSVLRYDPDDRTQITRRHVALLSGMLVLAMTLAAGCWFGSERRGRGPEADASVFAYRADGHDTAVVFVHGVRGDREATFKSRSGVAWPDLVRQDPLFKDVDIYSVGYPSVWFGRNLSVRQLADHMQVALTSAGLLAKYSRLIFVCHSMGGLVTRSFLTAYRDAARDKIGFIYFFGTPSQGSELATAARVLFPDDPQFTNMSPREGEPFLQALHSDWFAAGYGRTITSYCAYEAKPTLGPVFVVPWASASGLCNQSLIAIEDNHFGIVKPESINDKPHLALRAAFIESAGRAPLDRVQLIPSNHFELMYLREARQISFSFKGVVKSTRGAGDAIVDVYATLYGPGGQTQIPFSDRDHECLRDTARVTTPFLFAASEIACTFRQTLGDITRAALERPGPHRAVITFETDDKRGHAVQYCFTLDEDDVKDLLKGIGRRYFAFAICSVDSGGET